MSEQKRDLDLVVWGATGFTGRLVADYLFRRYGAQGELRWGLAGRSEDRLKAVRSELGADAADLPLVIADSHDRASLDRMAAATRVVLTTVGPYALYGSELVAACVAAGTDYCDLSGEVPWMRQMLDVHRGSAAESGARIVHCCGFDSIPSDLGVFFLQQAAHERFGQPLERVRLRVKAAKGGLSGGTIASMLNIVEEARRDKETAKVLKNPYALNPPEHRKGPRQPYVSSPVYDKDFQSWSAPFVMAAINTRVVHRSNALQDFRYGRDFRYDEAVLAGDGFGGRMKATGISLGTGAFALGAGFGPSRKIMKKFFLPDQGEGPTPEQQAAGFFVLILRGRTADGRTLAAKVSGDRDPGYGSTSKMISETAMTLLDTRGEAGRNGGFWTPATALGETLIQRLEKNAGLSFELIEN